MVCPCCAHGLVSSAGWSGLMRLVCMTRSKRPFTPSGSMRQRTPGSWALRAYSGVDAFTGRVTYRTRTVRGTKAEASKSLRGLVAVAQCGPAFGARASFGSLLEAWLGAKTATWSVSMLRETKSIVSHHLVPRLGSVPVGAVTTEQIDQVLTGLRRTLSVGTVSRIRMVIHAALAQCCLFGWRRLLVLVVVRSWRCRGSILTLVIAGFGLFMGLLKVRAVRFDRNAKRRTRTVLILMKTLLRCFLNTTAGVVSQQMRVDWLSISYRFLGSRAT